MSEIICISGDLYSGKSTVGKLVAEKLGYEYFSTGALFRSMAGDAGMSVMEFTRLAEVNPDIDRSIDEMLVETGRTRSRIVIDSRMAWHFVNDSFKVHLVIDLREAARRAMSDERRGEKYKSMDEALEYIKGRKESESERYSSKYGVNMNDFKNYDCIIDTTLITPYEVVKMILKQYR